LLASGFEVIAEEIDSLGQVFVDTKFEFGYATNRDGANELIYMDEVGTPDSSRIWDANAYAKGQVVDNSKEGFRQALLAYADDPDVLINKDRMDERYAFASGTVLPRQMMMDVSSTYIDIAERITGRPLEVSENPRDDIIRVLREELGIIQD
jgi:phosphoribosylaminoimidazole-succinocarboxamide synthase